LASRYEQKMRSIGAGQPSTHYFNHNGVTAAVQQAKLGAIGFVAIDVSHHIDRDAVSILGVDQLKDCEPKQVLCVKANKALCISSNRLNA
jgi:hypothetical protein